MQIEPNDQLRVSKGGTSFVIRVGSACNYGTDQTPNWYIQGEREDNGRYVYIKQMDDGVTLARHPH